jgi:sirohydrochlorin ferrochelatase
MERGFGRLLDQGARRVAVMPLLLLAAGHAKRDIPAMTQRLAAEHPGVSIRLCRHVGCHQAIEQLSAQRFDQALAGRTTVAREHTLLVLVARGTSDDKARGEMDRFVRRRAARLPVDRVEVAFAAVAKPTLETALEHAASLPYQRIVVQPHLLFAGLVLEGIKDQVARFAQAHPERQWLVTEPLGAERLLTRAVVDLLVKTEPAVNAAAPNLVDDCV